ncbi:UbiA prenyltransferase [Methanosalsum zhilinae DSM 4017]|uniref:UbiA prenyltransferase n=1 Tax=Methanosalsum zhilinae (strain DSM 4017 / NBRC 107636 / OCM 62 / WeN5) TaxID=679901 RepID=F7XNL4_METZD|nr:UbiA family prenyltransferase [Methanosalsum zhilinae]AEH60111.1 UbiA prenyltransferase [Methanosalsum zhilinae DSM 4017]
MVSTKESKPMNPYLEMLRPEIADMDIALPAASALLASYIAMQSFPPLIPFIIAIIGGYAAITSSYVYNDCCDVDIDQANLPNRPLPSSRITRKQGLIYSFVLVCIASIAALYLNPESFVVLLFAVLTISLYSKIAKRKTPLSFVPVGIAYGLVPIGIWLAFDPAGVLKGTSESLLPLPAIFLGIMMCVTDWGFTLSGVSRDVEGDRANNAPTLPVKFGVPFTAKFVTSCWLVGVIASFVIGWTAHLGPIFFIGALLGGLWMLYQSFDFVKNPLPERGGKLFIQGSRYRGVMFGSLIVDVILSIMLTGYSAILW